MRFFKGYSNQMKFRNFVFILLVFCKLHNASAHSIDCAHFYANAVDFEKDLVELKKSFYPLNSSKQNYLENLHNSVRNFSKDSDKTLLFNDSDYGQFKIVKQIDGLLERADSFKKKNTWANDKALLVNAANGLLDANKNQWGNDPYENLGSYILAANEVALFVNEFTSYSSEWKRTRRVLPLERIQWVEMRSVSFIYIYTHIANCHTQFLSFETRDALKRNSKK
jgi:hypothetical protein